MGYFSNGTEAQVYESTFCERCIHFGDEAEGGCPVWGAHLLYAYELCNAADHPGKVILDWLIPRDENGLNGNGRCKMFAQDESKPPLPAWVAENLL